MMEYLSNEEIKIIDELVQISKSIYKLYEKLYQLEIDGKVDSKEYREIVEHIRLCKEFEEKRYDMLGIDFDEDGIKREDIYSYLFDMYIDDNDFNHNVCYYNLQNEDEIIYRRILNYIDYYYVDLIINEHQNLILASNNNPKEKEAIVELDDNQNYVLINDSQIKKGNIFTDYLESFKLEALYLKILYEEIDKGFINSLVEYIAKQPNKQLIKLKYQLLFFVPTMENEVFFKDKNEVNFEKLAENDRKYVLYRKQTIKDGIISLFDDIIKIDNNQNNHELSDNINEKELLKILANVYISKLSEKEFLKFKKEISKYEDNKYNVKIKKMLNEYSYKNESKVNKYTR